MSDGLKRRRKPLSDDTFSPPPAATEQVAEEVEDDKKEKSKGLTLDGPACSANFIILLILFVAAGCTAYYYIQLMNKPVSRADSTVSHEQLFPKVSRVLTHEELAEYSGTEDESQSIYLAVLGQVFDVTEGRRHYGPNGGYSFFSGIDASAAYITGKFKDGLTDDISQLSPQDVVELLGWVGFYHRTYTFVGVVQGRYFTAEGEPTPYYLEVVKRGEKGNDLKAQVKKLQTTYPGCNMRSRQNEPSQFWCTKKSAGVARDWVGFPREMIAQPLDELNTPITKCVCVPESSMVKGESEDYDVVFVEYEGCESDAEKCFLSKDARTVIHNKYGIVSEPTRRDKLEERLRKKGN